MNLQFTIAKRIFYGWAEKNTRPKIKSNEKRKRHKVNGLLCVDAITGEEYLQLKSQAKSEDIASYFGLLCDDLSNQGCRKVTIILDNNSTSIRQNEVLIENSHV